MLDRLLGVFCTVRRGHMVAALGGLKLAIEGTRK